MTKQPKAAPPKVAKLQRPVRGDLRTLMPSGARSRRKPPAPRSEAK